MESLNDLLRDHVCLSWKRANFKNTMDGGRRVLLKILSYVCAGLLIFLIFSPIGVQAREAYILGTIDHTKVDADLMDFPVMLMLDDSNAQDFFDRIVSIPQNSLKFRVEDTQGNLCFVEKELWNAVSRKVILHVKVPFVGAAEDTVIKLFYDESLPDNIDYVGETGSAAAQQVWDEDYLGVWHMADTDASTTKDSSVNTHDGTKVSVGKPQETDSLIGKGQDFEAQSERIDVGDIDIDGNGTIEAVVKADTVSGRRNIASK